MEIHGIGPIMSMRYHFKSTIFEDEDSAFGANHQDVTMLRLRQRWKDKTQTSIIKVSYDKI